MRLHQETYNASTNSYREQEFDSTPGSPIHDLMCGTVIRVQLVTSTGDTITYTKVKVVVEWETLNGNIRSRKFDTWQEAETFGEKMEQNPTVQWVDIKEQS